MSLLASTDVVGSGGHAVQLYASDEALIDSVATFLADAVFAGGVGIAVATAPHRAALAERLVTATGVPPLPGTVLVLDAAELLGRLLVGGRPDAGRFDRSVGELLRTARAAADGAAGGPVHVFGEMVALLWADDRVGAALELERLWNDLRRRCEFSLLCAYPAGIAEAEEDAGAVDEVCRLHTSVLAPSLRAAGSDWVRRHFEAGVDAPREARRFVAAQLVACGEERLAGDAALVVSELATNAVLHARSRFSISVSVEDGRVQLAVEDGSKAVPRRRKATEGSTAGRGLDVVSALTTSWGVHPTAGGKVVWADLAGQGHPRAV